MKKVYYSKPRRTNLSITRRGFKKLVNEIIRLSGLEISDDWSIVINFVTARQICKMNSEHMNHHGITDVISFSYLTEYDLSPDPGVFGEVFICIEKAKSESEERNISFTDELTLYIVHGILHIASYDDMDPSSRKRMRLAEAYCMNNLKKQFSLSEIFALKNPNKQC